jgi:hypothetical protein
VQGMAAYLVAEVGNLEHRQHHRGEGAHVVQHCHAHAPLACAHHPVACHCRPHGPPQPQELPESGVGLLPPDAYPGSSAMRDDADLDHVALRSAQEHLSHG